VAQLARAIKRLDVKTDDHIEARYQKARLPAGDITGMICHH